MLFIERCAGEQGLRPSASLPTAMTGHFHHRDLRKGCCLSSTKTSRAGPISSRHTKGADSQTAKEALSDTPANNSIQQVRRPGSILCRHLGEQGLDSPCLREAERGYKTLTSKAPEKRAWPWKILLANSSACYSQAQVQRDDRETNSVLRLCCLGLEPWTFRAEQALS